MWFALQCANVERTLLAVTQLAEGNNDVILRKKSGTIYNTVTKKSIHLARRGGTYTLNMWVWDPEEDATDSTKRHDARKPESGFPRQVE